jgi:hypothetical protein
MGTRNLVIIVSNNETKLAQYNQFDGYPSYMGVNLLNEIKKLDLIDFKEKLNFLSFADEKTQKSIEDYSKTVDDDKFFSEYPLLHRDVSFEIIPIISQLDKTTICVDSSKFAGDSLFCEWGYVIDLDKNKFEVYKGFNKKPLTEDERFYNTPIDDVRKIYKQIRFYISFDLNDLPTTDEEFLSQFDEN